MLDKAAILAAPDMPTEEVAVPEWGGTVKVRGLTAAERDVFDTTCFDGNGKLLVANFRAQLVVRTVVDDAGVRIFADTDVELLGGKASTAIDRLFSVGQRLSGLGNLGEKKGN